MMNLKYLVLIIAIILTIGGYARATVIGTSFIRAPAVIIENNTGSLTNISITITNGIGIVNITGPQYINLTTKQSAYTAAMYASHYTNENFSKYNFDYNIANVSNVSGPSAGAAMTIIAISAFMDKPIRPNFTMTGTIDQNGNIGEIGGVYDKVNAAKNSGMNFVLVPKAFPQDQENELYLLVQTNFGIPLIQVANISQATKFAFNYTINVSPYKTNYSFYTNYNVNSLPSAPIQCTGLCNKTTFNELLNATTNLNLKEINNLRSNSKFSNISNQLYRVLNQSIAISNKGYIYTAADFTFLNYVNTFFFDSYSTNRLNALDTLSNIQNFCNSLTPPQLTSSNYNYVINAELRQYWGNYTINKTITSYNLSQIDSDQILESLYLGAQANGWCTAANLVYNEASTVQNSSYLQVSSSLKPLALERISNASRYGNSLYFATAQEAYRQGNYAVAILDADYAFSFGNATNSFTLTAQQLNNKTLSIINNSTYGVWASEFSNQAYFYLVQSESTSNATLSKSYAQNAYTVALLASFISNDTKTISNNLVPLTQQEIQNQQLNNKILNDIVNSQIIIYALIVIIFILLIIIIVLLAMIMHRLKRLEYKQNKKRK